MTGFLSGPPGFQWAQRKEAGGERDELHAEWEELHPKLP